jgi:hypothetical protein
MARDERQASMNHVQLLPVPFLVQREREERCDVEA